MPKKIATISLGLHGSKSSVLEELNNLVVCEDITQDFANSLVTDLPGRRYPIQYVNYEVMMYVDIFDDGTFKISHLNCDGDLWIRGKDKDIQI